MRDFLYPLSEWRANLLGLTKTFGAVLFWFVGTFMLIALWVGLCLHADAQNSQTMPWYLAVLFPFIGLWYGGGLLVLALGGSGYLLDVVNNGIEGDPRLPKIRLFRQMRRGFVHSLMMMVSVLLPTYAGLFAIGVVLVGMAHAVSLAGQAHEVFGILTGLLAAGGAIMGLMLFSFVLFTCLAVLVPIMTARYVKTGSVRSYFSPIVACRAIAKSPGHYILAQLPMWSFNLFLMSIYFVTFGIGHMFFLPLMPLFALNNSYLTGRYYGRYVLE